MRGTVGLVLIAALALLPMVASAQAPASYLQWDFQRPLTEVQGYQQTVRVDGAVVTGAPACTGNATSATCQLAIPAPTSKPQVYSVSAVVNGVEHTTNATIDASRGPGPVSGIRIAVTVTVQVGQ